MIQKLFSSTRGLGLSVCAALLSLSVGCVGYVERPQGRSARVTRTVVAGPVFIEQDDYVYYPSYQVYYGSRSHQYYYQDGPSWVARPAPLNLSVSVLLASPSVTMDFHDGPSAHHAQVIRTYPRTWTKSGGNNGRKEGHKKNSRDDRRDDDRRDNDRR